MNDPTTLDLYTQLLLFSKDPAKQQVNFSNLDDAKQAILRGLAPKLGLKYTCNANSQFVEKSRSSFPSSENKGYYVLESNSH